jgi:hypothetical protein
MPADYQQVSNTDYDQGPPADQTAEANKKQSNKRIYNCCVLLFISFGIFLLGIGVAMAIKLILGFIFTPKGCESINFPNTGTIKLYGTINFWVPTISISTGNQTLGYIRPRKYRET